MIWSFGLVNLWKQNIITAIYNKVLLYRKHLIAPHALIYFPPSVCIGWQRRVSVQSSIKFKIIATYSLQCFETFVPRIL